MFSCSRPNRLQHMAQTDIRKEKTGRVANSANSLPAPQTVAPKLPPWHHSTKQRVRKQGRKGRAHSLTLFLPRGLFCLRGFSCEQLLFWPLILSNSTLCACIRMTGIHMMLLCQLQGQGRMHSKNTQKYKSQQSPNMNPEAEHAAGQSLGFCRMSYILWTGRRNGFCKWVELVLWRYSVLTLATNSLKKKLLLFNECQTTHWGQVLLNRTKQKTTRTLKKGIEFNIEFKFNVYIY